MNIYWTFVLLLLSIETVKSQHYFNTVISHSQAFVEGLQHQADVIETDTSIICFPNTALRNANGEYGSVNILDPNGKFLNRSVFIDSIYSFRITNILQDTDAIWMTGYRYVPDSFKYNYWFGKFDKNLDSIWTKTIYTQQNTSRIEKIIKLNKDTFVILGYEQSTRPSGATIESWPVLIWIHNDGKVLHRLDINDNNKEIWEVLRDLIFADDGYIYACGEFNTKTTNNDKFMAKISADGELVWKKSYQKLENAEWLGNIFLEPDGTLTAVGSRRLPNFFQEPKYHGFLMVNFDNNGNILSEKTTFWEYSHNPSFCIRNEFGDFICAGNFVDTTGGNRRNDGLVFKVSKEGELLWYRVIDYSPKNELFWMITAARDGGYFLTGMSWYPGDNSSKPWIVKVDQHGCLVPGCESAVSTEEPEDNPQAFKIFPNPAGQILNLLDHWDSSEELMLELIDASGQMMMFRSFRAQLGKQHLFDLDPKWPDGLYLLQVRTSFGKVIFSDRIQLIR
jgi:hypothetical protein